MTREARNDVVIFALAISLAVHLAGMFWARPKVMTTVAAGAPRHARRGPMDVSKAQDRPDPVKIDVLKDIAPTAAAPDVAPVVAGIPPGDATEQPPEATEIRIPEPEMPEVLSRLAPSEAKMPAREPAAADSAPKTEAKMVSDAIAVAPIGTADSFALAPFVGLPAAPTVEPAPVEPPKVQETAEAPKMEKDDKAGAEKDFKPVEEVMPEVDEAIVEQEKAAVKGLVDVADADDLTRYVTAVASAAAGADRQTYFRLKIIPKAELRPVPKDMVVLIDASGSIGKERMRSIRAAAKRILRSATNSGDRFNLVAFRDRFSYAFRKWQGCTEVSFSAADHWLEDVTPHGRTDVFSTIASVLTLPRDPARPLVALVVTDGEANSGVSDAAEIVSRFTALNDGLVSVYMYGVKSSANRELFDALTRANRGDSFVHEGSRRSAGVGIDELSERFRDPVLSDLRIVFASSSRAEAYPRLLKNLYRGETLEIVGRVPEGVSEIAFSLKGLNGPKAYEGFFRLSLATASADPGAEAAWRAEAAIDARIR